MTQTCLFIGRFQPFHKGHVMVVSGMKKVCGKMVIGIGSPYAKQDKENPLTLEERHEMISAALLEADIHDATIVDCPDTDDDAQWVNAVLKATGPVDTVWTGNELVLRLCSEKGIKVQKISEVPGVSGTEIRAKSIAGQAWKDMVSNSVGRFLERAEFDKRMRHFRGN